MARIIGYERAAFHRLMKSTAPASILTLYKLSLKFNLPMNFWFPTSAGELPIKLPVYADCVCQDATPLTIKIFERIKKLSPAQKNKVLDSAKIISEGEAISGQKSSTSLKIERVINGLTSEQQEKVLKVINEVFRPAPAGP